MQLRSRPSRPRRGEASRGSEPRRRRVSPEHTHISRSHLRLARLRGHQSAALGARGRPLVRLLEGESIAAPNARGLVGFDPTAGLRDSIQSELLPASIGFDPTCGMNSSHGLQPRTRIRLPTRRDGLAASPRRRTARRISPCVRTKLLRSGRRAVFRSHWFRLGERGEAEKRIALPGVVAGSARAWWSISWRRG